MAMAMQHTPGPWTFDATGGGQVRATDHKGSFPICDIRGWGHLTGKGHGALGLSNEDGAAIQDANARLIAAAPDMLAALQLVIYRPDGWPDVKPSELVELAQRTKDAVKAAIAKAQG